MLCNTYYISPNNIIHISNKFILHQVVTTCNIFILTFYPMYFISYYMKYYTSYKM